MATVEPAQTRLQGDLRPAKVSEVFGPTLQGEGPSAGTPALFVRFGLCNLDCSWCDTPYTWDWTRYDKHTELANWTVDDIVSWVQEHDTRLVVLTGGEPLLHARHITQIIHRLPTRRFEIETNGTIHPNRIGQAGRTQFNVSPKLAGSNVGPIRHPTPDAIAAFIEHGANWKFVITNNDDLQEVNDFTATHRIPNEHVYLMPQGTDPATLNTNLPQLFDHAATHNMNVTDRLHVRAHGNKRGI